MPLLVVIGIFLVAYKVSYDDQLKFNWRSITQRFTGRSQFIFAQFENVLEDQDGRITISHTQPTPSTPSVSKSITVETGVECKDEESGMEMVAGGPEDLTKDKLDEVVETIGASNQQEADLISVDM